MSAKIFNIVSAEAAGDLRLHLCFDDGTEQVVDFRPFLSHSVHPDIRAYLDPVLFATFRVEYGDLIWGDYDLCFPINDLYRNQLEKSTTLEAAA